MRTIDRLRTFFQVSSLSVAALAPACGGSTSADPSAGPGGLAADSGPTAEGGASAATFCNGDQVSFMPDVVAAVPADFIELRTYDAATMKILASSNGGVACSGALDAAACTKDLASRRDAVDGDLASGLGLATRNAGRLALVYTRAGEVGAASTQAELQSFLLPIASLGSAALWAAAAKSYGIVCPQSDARVTSGGFELLVEGCIAAGATPAPPVRAIARIAPDGSVSTAGDGGAAPPSFASGCIGAGRRPEGFALSAPMSACAGLRWSGVAEYFVTMAQLEAASVFAFQRLASELAEGGAPADLVSRALAAADDEIEHASLMRGLAARAGAFVPEVVAGPYRRRPLAEIVAENAVEGCVRETFGALLATWQAEHATLPVVREAMQAIARDETRHAALSWDVATWSEVSLSIAARTSIAVRRAEAFAVLAAELEAATDQLDEASRRTLGLPDLAQGLALLESFRVFSQSLETAIAA